MSEPSPGDVIDFWPPGTLHKRPWKGWTFEGVARGRWVLSWSGVKRTADPKSTWRPTEERDL